MPTEPIHQWSTIAKSYSDALLLGNGASIAIESDFRYSSLLSAAQQLGNTTPSVDRVFREFKTVDFKFILHTLSTAIRVNKALGVRDYSSKRTYNWTRRALIDTVRKIHPSHASILHHFPAIASFIRGFERILSVNYDLILYCAFMWASNDNPAIRFKDCFDAGQFQYDWDRYAGTMPGEQKVILVFYPHGKLSLASSPFGEEVKISAGGLGTQLLSNMVRRWENDQLAPLVVSEGDSQAKLVAIKSSRYLDRVYESVMHNAGKSLFIYGWRIGQSDTHIMNALMRGPIRRVAISVMIGGGRNVQAECLRLKQRVLSAVRAGRTNPTVRFFDARSAGAWIY